MNFLPAPSPPDLAPSYAETRHLGLGRSWSCLEMGNVASGKSLESLLTLFPLGCAALKQYKAFPFF